MSISKHRKTIAVLFASVSFAAAAGPLVSAANAAPKGSGSTPTTQNSQCQGLHNAYHSDLEAATQAYANGYDTAGSIFVAQANDDKANAQDLGCSWAAAVATPTKPTNVVRPTTATNAPAVK
jgi:hypothetical protein